MAANGMRHFVKVLLTGREEPLVCQVDEETADRIRRNLAGEPRAFCRFSTLDGREVAVNLAQLDLVHFLWDAAMPELSAVEHHPARLHFIGRSEAFVCDPEDEDEAFDVFFLLEVDGAELDRFLELTDEDGEVVVFDASKLQAIEMSSALVAEGAADFDGEVGPAFDQPGEGHAAPAPDVERTGEADRLAGYVRSLPDFEMVEDLAIPYDHMGATITDAVLQAGLRYETVVWPRVQHVMTIPEAATTSGFLAVLREHGGEEVVHWTDPVKLGRMEAVAELFIAERVETESDLRMWLCGDAGAEARREAPDCAANVAQLAAVHGIGPKTIDYFMILCGEQDAAAIDMHLTRFLEQAGVRVTSYEQARQVIGGAAAELGVPAARLDHSIWTYMSKAGRTW